MCTVARPPADDGLELTVSREWILCGETPRVPWLVEVVTAIADEAVVGTAPG